MKILFFRETELKELNPSVMQTRGIAGTENSLVCLAQELSKYHIVKVIAPQSKQQFFDSVEYIPFQSYAEVLIHFLIFQPDVFIISGNPSILFEHNFNCKTIFWQQNHPIELENRFDIRSLLDKITIVAPSPEAAVYYNEYYQTNKIIGIYNGVRDEFFKQTRAPIRNKIIYSGSFYRTKGLDVVLMASKLLSEFDFYCCGSFDLYGFVDEIYKKYCESLIKDSKNVHFTGNLNGTSLARELSAAEICVVNPLKITYNYETCCNSALEAMVVGVPVISGESKILSQIVLHGGVPTNNLVQTVREIADESPVWYNSEFIDQLSYLSIGQQWQKLL